MSLALAMARRAFKAGEIPVGAIITQNTGAPANAIVIATAHNRREKSACPFDHAEMVALKKAAKKLRTWRLNDCTLYVTLEPCPMCLGALFQARVKTLVFGCLDEKRLPGRAGKIKVAFPSLATALSKHGTARLAANNHNLKIIGGVMAEESAAILLEFFKRKRTVLAKTIAVKPS